MKCAAESTLRAFVDDELPRLDNERLAEHIQSCAGCAQKAARMASESREVHRWLDALATASNEEVDPKVAYARYQAAVADRRLHPPKQILPGWLRVPQISAAGVAAALILLFCFTPVRSLGQHFLRMLRVQKVAVIPVETSSLNNGQRRGLSQLISDSVVVTLKPGNPLVVPHAAAAAAKVGFNVETLENLGKPQQIDVQDEAAFHMTLDLEKIRAVLQEAGRSDIQVPDSINGSTVAVHVPKGVRMQYGNCNDPKKDPAEDNCIVFVQIPSPIVSVPPGLNMPALAEAALQLAGLSASEATNFAHTVDWSSTLVIPVPQDRASYRTVPVEGVNGTLIEMAPGRGYRGGDSVVWVKNGVVRSIASHHSSAQVLAAISGLGS